MNYQMTRAKPQEIIHGGKGGMLMYKPVLSRWWGTPEEGISFAAPGEPHGTFTRASES